MLESAGLSQSLTAGGRLEAGEAGTPPLCALLSWAGRGRRGHWPAMGSTAWSSLGIDSSEQLPWLFAAGQSHSISSWKYGAVFSSQFISVTGT